MRRHTPRFATLSSAAVLLLGCTEGHPLAPPSTADAARGGTTVAAPSAVVAVAVSDNRIDLQWTDNSSNETRFEILLSMTGESGQFYLRARTGVDAVTYTDGSLQQRTQYCYQVRAVRQTGARTDYSPSSNTTCATTPPLLPPTAPSNLTVVAVSSEQVDAAWQDNSSDETGFEISQTYSEGSGTYTNIFQLPANAQTYRFGSLLRAEEYCYRVRAFVTTAYGLIERIYSAYSNTACVLTPLGTPPPVSGAVAVPSGSASVTVSWTGVWRDGDSFRIDRSTDGGVVWQVAGTVPNLPFTDEQLPSERSVCYRVVAYNSTAAAAPSNTTCTTPPAAPTEATVRRVTAGVLLELTWRDNSAVEEGYEVLITVTDCANDGSGGWGCWTTEYLLGVVPAGSTQAALPDWGYPNLAGPISVRAMKDGGYSDPAVVESVTP